MGKIQSSQCFGGNNTSGQIRVAAALGVKGGSGRMDFESETLIAHTLRGESHDANEDGTGRGVPQAPAELLSIESFGWNKSSSQTMRVDSLTSDALQASPQSNPAIAFNLRGRDGGSLPEECEAASLMAASGGSSRSYVASTLKSNNGGGGFGSDPSETFIDNESAVRRLTPTECERLQGFPDGYTALEGAADGPRYKALGNSMAVPVIRWIGLRIIAAIEASS